jgi:hypothetical protein
MNQKRSSVGCTVIGKCALTDNGRVHADCGRNNLLDSVTIITQKNKQSVKMSQGFHTIYIKVSQVYAMLRA